MTTPPAVIITVEGRLYMSIRDWDGPGGDPRTGIADLDSAFSGDPELKAEFLDIVGDKSLYSGIETLIGNSVVADGEKADTPQNPTMCAFRMEFDGSSPDNYFLARDFTQVGSAQGQEFSVFVILEEGADVIERGNLIKSDATAPKLFHNDVLATTLLPVFSSVTITKPKMLNAGARSSQGYGDERQY